MPPTIVNPTPSPVGEPTSRCWGFVNIAILNIHGQSKLSLSKQHQIEDFVKSENVDVLHCQEINVNEDSFKQCRYLNSQFNLIPNNALNEYGTACFVKTDFEVSNLKCDTEGRAIIFSIGDLTLGNVYLKSGTDNISRNHRETYCSETIPQLLVNCKDAGNISGDWNCITDKEDCTKHPEAKMSPCLKRLIKLFNLKDAFRSLHPDAANFSRFYNQGGEGATRIDRSYSWGEVEVLEARYVPVAFSDHLAHVVKLKVPEATCRSMSVKAKPFFKTSPEVVQDQVFQERVAGAMKEWEEVKGLGLPMLRWWELYVKPGIRRIALRRSKELYKQKRGALNLLLLRQVYVTNKLQTGEVGRLGELREVQENIKLWYEEESKKIIIQSRVDDVQFSEKVRIFHHEQHQKLIKRSAILQLDTEHGTLTGHSACSSYLEEEVAKLLLHPATLDTAAQEILLAEVEPVFTDEDNRMLLAPPSQDEVKEVLFNSNLKAAPGTDGLTSLLYKECWNSLGSSLHEMVTKVWEGEPLTLSQRTSLMVFGSKPKKPHSKKPSDKRRISLLNSDLKLITGIEAFKFKHTLTHALSPLQVVSGNNRRIHHAINKARDAINSTSSSKAGCALMDLDFISAFCFQTMEWVLKVAEAKGLDKKVISRIKHISSNRVSIPVVNNIPGKAIPNRRGTLSQGCPSSMNWFTIGIDPLLTYLERRLQGIVIHSLPTFGPRLKNGGKPAPVEERYKVYGLADDVKPSVCNMAEFSIIDHAASLFERSSGCKLHRDPASGKCKVLPLGRWRNTLQQEDIPFNFMKLTKSLAMVGVELTACWMRTRQVNCSELRIRIQNTVNAWRSGKFNPLVSRSYSLNSYCLSKIWFRTSSVDLRVSDVIFIHTKCRSYICQDLLQKPSEIVLFRAAEQGGLGLHHVQSKATAHLISTFLQTAANPRFISSQFHAVLFRYHVLEEVEEFPNPGFTPYYTEDFFNIIKKVHQKTPLNPVMMSINQWYKYLLEQNVTMSEDDQGRRQLLRSRIEHLEPGVDWGESYRLARQKGLSPEQKSFLFKMIHQLLPVKERVHRIMPSKSPLCSQCSLATWETMHHAFYECQANSAAAVKMLNCARVYAPALTEEGSLRLEVIAEDPFALPTITLISTGLQLIWKNRQKSCNTSVANMKAEMEARGGLLRAAQGRRLREAGAIMANIIHSCF